MTLKKIDSAIKRIVTNGDKLNMLIHSTAMLIAEHAKEHGDCTRALTLVKAMPASMRRTMLVLWFDTYTPIRVILANDKVGMLKESAKTFTPFDLEAGNETPFFTLAEQNPESKDLDFDKMVALVKALGKRIEKKIEAGAVVEKDRLSATAIASTLASLTFEKIADAGDPNNVKLHPTLEAIKQVVNG